MAKDFNIENEMSSLSKTVANLSKENPFSLPSTYFSEFPARILQKIENELLVEEEPVLSNKLLLLKDQNPFELPPQYFEYFSVQPPVKKGKLIQFFSHSWTSYAAAACMVGLIFGIINIYTVRDQGNLASKTISKDEIENYLTETEGLAIIEKEPESIGLESNSLVDVSSTSIAEMLKEIPDKDISRYMDLNAFDEMNKIN